MLLHEKLTFDIYSDSEKIITEYLLENMDTIEDMTTSSIAKKTYTNTTSLIRIAKKLDLKGWTDLKKELIKERDYLNSNLSNIDANKPFATNDSELTIANKLATLIKESIDDTLQLVDIEEVKNICKLIYQKKNVMIFSGITNINLLNNFAYSLRRLNFNVQVSTNYDYPQFEAYNLDQDSIAFFISYSGNNPELLPLLRLVKQNKVDIISLTSIGDNIIVRNSKYNLKMSSQEKLFSKVGHFNTTASLLYLLDLIYSVIFTMDYEKNYKKTVDMNQKLETRTTENFKIQEDF